MKLIPVLAISMIFSSTAFADEATDKENGHFCHEAKDLVKMMTKIASMKPEQTDTVHGNPTMKIDVKDDLPMPKRMFFRHEGVETPFSLSPEGDVTDLKKIAGLDKDGEMCLEFDKNSYGEGKLGKFGIGMNFHIEYKNKTGTHTISELRDGLDDGRAHVKKLVPGPVRMLIPKFTHVKIAYTADKTDPIHQTPQIVALQGDVKVDGLDTEKMFDSFYVDIDQLEELQADRLGIYGGEYRMEPSASPKKMRKMIEKRQKAEAENNKD